jgi:hypothetical protein
VQPEDDLLPVNCGRCGKHIVVRVEEVRELRIIECSECAAENKPELGLGPRRLPPFKKATD